MADHFPTTAAEFQTAINAAALGDTIFLEAGTTYDGQFTYPDKGAGTSYITVRSDADDADLPAEGVRITPAYKPFMPIVRRASHVGITNTVLPAGHHWKWFGIFFNENPGASSSSRGTRVQMDLGVDTDDYNTRAKIPHHLIVDRCIFEGHPLYGGKVAINVAANDVEIINNHFEHFGSHGFQSFVLGAINCYGPLRIENNFISGGSHSFISGGGSGQSRTSTTVAASPAPTNTTATLGTTADLVVGQIVAFLTASGTRIAHGEVTNIAGNDITFTPLIEAHKTPNADPVPDVPGNCRYGAQLANLTFTRNHVRKDPANKGPRLGMPTGVSATPFTDSGSLAAGTYGYRVQARGDGYGDADSRGYAATEVQVTLGATGRVTVSWNAVPHAEGYYIYRHSPVGTITRRFVVGGVTTFDDVGAGGTATSSILSPIFFLTMTLLELKECSTAHIHSNIFEDNWASGDGGQVFWIKSVNQEGSATYASTSNILIENNLCRRVNGFTNISGRETGGGLGYQPHLAPHGIHGLTFRNNLLIDSNPNHRQENHTSADNWCITLANGDVVDLVMRHNTLIHNARDFLSVFANTNGRFIDPIWEDNFFRRRIFSGSFGKTALDEQTVNYTYNNNVHAGWQGTQVTGNFYSTDTAWEGEFVDYNGGLVGGDFNLNSESPYNDAATDTGDIGVDISALEAAIAGVESGEAGGSVGVAAGTSTAVAVGTTVGGTPAVGALLKSSGSFNTRTTLGEQTIPLGIDADVVLLFCNRNLGTVEGGHGDHNLMVGFAAKGGSPPPQRSGGYYSKDNVTTSVHYANLRDASCLSIQPEGAVIRADAAATLVGTDLVLDYSVVSAASVRVDFLALGNLGDYDIGTINSPSASGTQDYTAPGFQPDLLFLWNAGNDGGAPPQTSAQSTSHGLGWATGPTEQGCVITRITNNATTSNARGIQRTDRIQHRLSTSGGDFWVAEFDSFLANGFRLDWTVTVDVTTPIFYLAIRTGHQVKAGSFLQPTTAGLQSHTTVGFQPELVLFQSHCRATVNAAITDARYMLGMAVNGGGEVSLFGGERHNVTTTIARGSTALDRCIDLRSEATGTTTRHASANLDAFTLTGFDLDWADADATQRSVLFLAIGSAEEEAGGQPARTMHHMRLLRG